MEHLCHQCGLAVEEGEPFCSKCGAPQIRIPQMEEAATPSFPPGTPGDVQPPAQPLAVGGAAPAPALATGAVQWPAALPAAAMSGAVLAVAWVIPYVGYFLWMVAAGVLAVAFYRRRAPAAELTTAIGARIGAVCGLFGFAGFAGLMAIGLLLLRGSGKFRALLQQAVQQAASRNPDPRAQELLNQMMSPAGLALLITVVMVMFLVGFVALSSAGGAIGASLFKPRGDRG